ncbi:hypothetical protein [Algibacter lectus]|uniref:Adenylate cyclase n=1 Tax=Algibacter lectus TaxID=221126 RepID=A0A4R8ME73_9FLAO|nr:hypothetical protein [Algibacter lectus]MWW24167.1 hypothetical protein [Algibacter lectus]TDY62185.1 hypothetical protein DFQ06_2006 [Algibacter lectus]
MFNQSEIINALTKVLESKTFSKSTTTNVLLKLLVESTIEGHTITAYTVGLELFGKRYDPKKSDVNIRVNISHLRKRLKRYYEEEGVYDPIVISIKPGQYNTTFSAREEKKNNSLKRKKIVGFIFSFVVFTAVAFFLLKPSNKVWKPMFDNGFETTLYLGDVFGYSGSTIFNNTGWHRDSKINSVEAFLEHTKKNPERFESLIPSEFSYIVFENAFNIKPFTQFFTKNNYNFSIRPISNFKTRSIKDRNTIYAGPLFTQSSFNELFNDFSYNVSLEVKKEESNHYSFNYTNEEGENKIIKINSRDSEGEYAIASGFNGPNNSRHYIFFSNHGMGLTSVIEYFTDIDSVQEFSDAYLSASNEFIAIFFVKGKDRTSLSMELVFFDDNK